MVQDEDWDIRESITHALCLPAVVILAFQVSPVFCKVQPLAFLETRTELM